MFWWKETWENVSFVALSVVCFYYKSRWTVQRHSTALKCYAVCEAEFQILFLFWCRRKLKDGNLNLRKVALMQRLYSENTSFFFLHYKQNSSKAFDYITSCYACPYFTLLCAMLNIKIQMNDQLPERTTQERKK